MILTPHGPRAYMRSALTLIVAAGVVAVAQSCSGPDAPDADYVTGLIIEDVVAPELTEDAVAVAPELTEDEQVITTPEETRPSPTPEEARRLVQESGELVRQQLLQSGLSAGEIRARLTAAGIPANALDQFFSGDAVAPQLTAGRLPYTPDDGQLEAELAEHHPGVLENGLPEGQSVWFIVDEDLNVLRTGIDESENLEERLQADYPAETTDYALGFGVPLGGEIVDVVWMVPEPPPGWLPPLD